MTIQPTDSRLFPSDAKQPLLDDVESTMTDTPTLPSYHLEEPNTELVVGGSKRGWFSGCRKWRERRGHGCCGAKDADGKKRKRCGKARRAVKFLVAFGMLFVAVKSFLCFRAFRSLHSLDCVPLESGSLEQTYIIPIESASTKLVFHSSFAAPDVRVLRDESVPEGEIHVSVKGDVPAAPTTTEDDEKDSKPLVCTVSHKKFSGAAFLSAKKETLLPSLTSLIVRVPATVSTPSVKLLGANEGPSQRKLRKIIKWWRKCHHGKSEEKIELEH